ncbi:hypothetical protein F5Y10DRAFT_272354 [Nemania abortiva]|nr:hypothetical protein F5Y10DRAFT_272354 [Nemania abortiva]
MVYEDINMNATRGDDATSCINPAEIMYNTSTRSNSIKDNSTSLCNQGVLLYNAPGQSNANTHDKDIEDQPDIEDGMEYGVPSAGPAMIRCKLFFLVAAHKTVQTGKEFVAVARIPKARHEENPFVKAQGKAYHYIPEAKHRQFNTSIPLTAGELAGAAYNDEAFVVHKAAGSSCAPAGTYLVYRLKRTEPGTRNLRFEATWELGNGIMGTASYDFVALKAEDDHVMKQYTPVQKKLLSDLWPEWENYIEC